MAGTKRAEIIRPAPLADKVPSMGGPKPDDAIRRAEKAVDKVAGEFEGLLGEELAELDRLMAVYRESGSQQSLDALFRRVHNLRGQGTTLGFPLITRIGTSFCRYLIERDPARPVNAALVEQHLRALHVVLKQRQAKAGDAVANEVAAALEQAVARELP